MLWYIDTEVIEMKKILHECSGGGYFHIRVLTGDSPETKKLFDGYSVLEEDFESFLHYYMVKYFDADLSGKFRYGDYCVEFEWYLDENVYTYDTMKKILREIEHTAYLLKYNYNSPELDEIKSRFQPYSFKEDFDYNEMGDKERFIEENKSVAIDFYRDFCAIIEGLMRKYPEYNLITFSGP